MEKLDITNYLYHGIVDWENYNNGKIRDDFCLDKLESILKSRYIYRPCEFKKHGINHDDYANLYTFYFTFVACHYNSIYASKYKKDIKDDNGYLVATDYAKFGILFDIKLLNDLTICEYTFCDKEIVLEDDIPLDKYGVAIYINPIYVEEEIIKKISILLKKYDYNFNIVNVLDGSVIKLFNDEKIYSKTL